MSYTQAKYLQPKIIFTNRVGNNICKYLFEYSHVQHTPLLFFRISIGLFIIIHHVSILSDINLLFGFNGILPQEVTKFFIDDFMISNAKLNVLLGLSNTDFLFVFNTVYILMAFFITIGFLTRMSTVIMIFLHASLLNSNLFFNYGVDQFTSMSLFYLLLFPVSNTCSIDTLLFKPKPKTNYLIYQRFIQIHLAIAYFFSGFTKLLGHDWRYGESIWKVINLPYSNPGIRNGLSWLSGYPFVLLILGWSVVILEMCYPIIFIKRIRKYWLAGIIAMHIGIALTLNLYFFATIMIIWNVFAFHQFKEGKTKLIGI